MGRIDPLENPLSAQFKVPPLTVPAQSPSSDLTLLLTTRHHGDSSPVSSPRQQTYLDYPPLATHPSHSDREDDPAPEHYFHMPPPVVGRSGSFQHTASSMPVLTPQRSAKALLLDTDEGDTIFGKELSPPSPREGEDDADLLKSVAFTSTVGGTSHPYPPESPSSDEDLKKNLPPLPGEGAGPPPPSRHQLAGSSQEGEQQVHHHHHHHHRSHSRQPMPEGPQGGVLDTPQGDAGGEAVRAQSRSRSRHHHHHHHHHRHRSSQDETPSLSVPISAPAGQRPSRTATVSASVPRHSSPLRLPPQSSSTASSNRGPRAATPPAARTVSPAPRPPLSARAASTGRGGRAPGAASSSVSPQRPRWSAGRASASVTGLPARSVSPFSSAASARPSPTRAGQAATGHGGVPTQPRPWEPRGGSLVTTPLSARSAGAPPGGRALSVGREVRPPSPRGRAVVAPPEPGNRRRVESERAARRLQMRLRTVAEAELLHRRGLRAHLAAALGGSAGTPAAQAQAESLRRVRDLGRSLTEVQTVLAKAREDEGRLVSGLDQARRVHQGRLERAQARVAAMQAQLATCQARAAQLQQAMEALDGQHQAALEAGQQQLDGLQPDRLQARRQVDQLADQEAARAEQHNRLWARRAMELEDGLAELQRLLDGQAACATALEEARRQLEEHDRQLEARLAARTAPAQEALALARAEVEAGEGALAGARRGQKEAADRAGRLSEELKAHMEAAGRLASEKLTITAKLARLQAQYGAELVHALREVRDAREGRTWDEHRKAHAARVTALQGEIVQLEGELRQREDEHSQMGAAFASLKLQEEAQRGADMEGLRRDHQSLLHMYATLCEGKEALFADAEAEEGRLVEAQLAIDLLRTQAAHVHQHRAALLAESAAQQEAIQKSLAALHGRAMAAESALKDRELQLAQSSAGLATLTQACPALRSLALRLAQAKRQRPPVPSSPPPAAPTGAAVAAIEAALTEKRAELTRLQEERGRRLEQLAIIRATLTRPSGTPEAAPAGAASAADDAALLDQLQGLQLALENERAGRECGPRVFPAEDRRCCVRASPGLAWIEKEIAAVQQNIARDEAVLQTWHLQPEVAPPDPRTPPSTHPTRSAHRPHAPPHPDHLPQLPSEGELARMQAEFAELCRAQAVNGPALLMLAGDHVLRSEEAIQARMQANETRDRLGRQKQRLAGLAMQREARLSVLDTWCQQAQARAEVQAQALAATRRQAQERLMAVKGALEAEERQFRQVEPQPQSSEVGPLEARPLARPMQYNQRARHQAKLQSDWKAQEKAEAEVSFLPKMMPLPRGPVTLAPLVHNPPSRRVESFEHFLETIRSRLAALRQQLDDENKVPVHDHDHAHAHCPFDRGLFHPWPALHVDRIIVGRGRAQEHAEAAVQEQLRQRELALHRAQAEAFVRDRVAAALTAIDRPGTGATPEQLERRFQEARRQQEAQLAQRKEAFQGLQRSLDAAQDELARGEQTLANIQRAIDESRQALVAHQQAESQALRDLEAARVGATDCQAALDRARNQAKTALQQERTRLETVRSPPPPPSPPRAAIPGSPHPGRVEREGALRVAQARVNTCRHSRLSPLRAALQAHAAEGREAETKAALALGKEAQRAAAVERQQAALEEALRVAQERHDQARAQLDEAPPTHTHTAPLDLLPIAGCPHMQELAEAQRVEGEAERLAEEGARNLEALEHFLEQRQASIEVPLGAALRQLRAEMGELRPREEALRKALQQAEAAQRAGRRRERQARQKALERALAKEVALQGEALEVIRAILAADGRPEQESLTVDELRGLLGLDMTSLLSLLSLPFTPPRLVAHPPPPGPAAFAGTVPPQPGQLPSPATMRLHYLLNGYLVGVAWAAWYFGAHPEPRRGPEEEPPSSGGRPPAEEDWAARLEEAVEGPAEEGAPPTEADAAPLGPPELEGLWSCWGLRAFAPSPNSPSGASSTSAPPPPPPPPPVPAAIITHPVGPDRFFGSHDWGLTCSLGLGWVGLGWGRVLPRVQYRRLLFLPDEGSPAAIAPLLRRTAAAFLRALFPAPPAAPAAPAQGPGSPGQPNALTTVPHLRPVTERLLGELRQEWAALGEGDELPDAALFACGPLAPAGSGGAPPPGSGHAASSPGAQRLHPGGLMPSPGTGRPPQWAQGTPPREERRAEPFEMPLGDPASTPLAAGGLGDDEAAPAAPAPSSPAVPVVTFPPTPTAPSSKTTTPTATTAPSMSKQQQRGPSSPRRSPPKRRQPGQWSPPPPPEPTLPQAPLPTTPRPLGATLGAAPRRAPAEPAPLAIDVGLLCTHPACLEELAGKPLRNVWALLKRAAGQQPSAAASPGAPAPSSASSAPDSPAGGGGAATDASALLARPMPAQTALRLGTLVTVWSLMRRGLLVWRRVATVPPGSTGGGSGGGAAGGPPIDQTNGPLTRLLRRAVPPDAPLATPSGTVPSLADLLPRTAAELPGGPGAPPRTVSAALGSADLFVFGGALWRPCVAMLGADWARIELWEVGTGTAPRKRLPDGGLIRLDQVAELTPAWHPMPLPSTSRSPHPLEAFALYYQVYWATHPQPAPAGAYFGLPAPLSPSALMLTTPPARLFPGGTAQALGEATATLPPHMSHALALTFSPTPTAVPGPMQPAPPASALPALLHSPRGPAPPPSSTGPTLAEPPALLFMPPLGLLWWHGLAALLAHIQPGEATLTPALADPTLPAPTPGGPALPGPLSFAPPPPAQPKGPDAALALIGRNLARHNPPHWVHPNYNAPTSPFFQLRYRVLSGDLLPLTQAAYSALMGSIARLEQEPPAASVAATPRSMPTAEWWNGDGENVNSCFGCATILIWASAFSVTRSMSEALGPFFGASLRYLIGGLLGILILGKKAVNVRHLPKKYLLVCGFWYVVNVLFTNLAVGFCANRSQSISISLINYLWPMINIVFSTFIIGSYPPQRWRWLLLIGGVTSAFWAEFLSNPTAYVLGVLAALTWPLYSNFNRRYAGATKEHGELKDAGVAVPFFITVSGGTLAIGAAIQAAMGLAPPLKWSFRAVCEVLFNALVATLLGSVLWDLAMRRGQLVFVSAFSFLAPLLATLAGSLYLGVPLTYTFVIGACLVVAGGVLSRLGVEGAPKVPPAVVKEATSPAPGMATPAADLDETERGERVPLVAVSSAPTPATLATPATPATPVSPTGSAVDAAPPSAAPAETGSSYQQGAPSAAAPSTVEAPPASGPPSASWHEEADATSRLPTRQPGDLSAP
ncbi:putative EamA family transporter [Paratrimastix pyriformis]|uniref:EamA family transporter n=1 Tax=Paratrimastix pyriformis TaxID=342808 RepID=A0ABQ8US32_9EUKA|nr:putative EamA family transporter [Paratrimastix pyriformis]